LEEDDVAQIRHLEDVCNRAEGIRIKFNWGMMRERDGAYISDFCYYREGQLVGYAPLDGFGGPFEVTAAVLPAYRRQGIFHTLFEAARKEAANCKARELLLVSYPASQAGTAAVERLGVTYRFSEYRMEAEATTIPPLPTGRLALEKVDAANVVALSRLLSLSFAGSRWNEPEALLKELEGGNKRYFLAMLENEAIGQIGVIAEKGRVYIRAVGIVPDRRGQGYGRQLLATTVQKMLNEGATQFELDVETKNRQALSLYESCGFRETMVYDYHGAPLPETPL
jgi:ribosomal protein S18 acetylase RimI-like enzyme